MILLLEQEDSDKVKDLINGIWGEDQCRISRSSTITYPIIVSCDISGRYIKFYHNVNNNTVEIEFFHDVVPVPSAKSAGEGFTSASELQKGTVEMMHKLKKTVQGLKNMGIGVAYSAEGRREDVYEKALKKWGLEQTPHEEYPIWR